MKPKNSPIGIAMLLGAAVIWGLAFSMQSMAIEHVGTFTINGIRYLIAALFLIPCILLFDRKSGRRLFSRGGGFAVDITRREWMGGALCGVLLFVATTLQQLGLACEGTDSGTAAFITALYVVLVPLLGMLWRKFPRPIVWVSAGIAVVGFYLLTGSLHFAKGDLLLLLCAVVFAFHVLVIDRFAEDTDGVRLSFVQFLVAGAMALPLFLLLERPSIAAIGAAIWPLVYLGIFSSGLGYTLQIVGQKRVDVSIAPMILSLESVFGVLGGALFLRETKTPLQYLGCAVVFTAVILSQLPERKK